MRFRVFLPLLLLTILLLVSAGRPVVNWIPDQLSDKSTCIYNGTVLEVTPLDERSVHTFTGVTPHDAPLRLYSAHVKVLATIKGGPAQDFEIRYYLFDEEKGGPWVNGPEEVRSIRGQRYRFYLKKSPIEPFYRPCLQGQFDDARSVEHLSDGDPDDLAPLLKQKAISLALDYLKAKFPSVTYDQSKTFALYETFYSPPGWMIEFWRDNGRPYPRSEDTEIHVNSNGSINEKASKILPLKDSPSTGKK